jgi:hypothetical protein
MFFYLPPAFEQPVVMHAEAKRPATAGSATFEGMTITCSPYSVPSIHQETVTTPSAVSPGALQTSTVTRAACEPMPREPDATDLQGPTSMSIDKTPQPARR